MAQSTTMTIRLEPEIKSRLDKLAAATHRSKSFLAARAVCEFVAVNEWQISELVDAVQEADAGDFASSEEVSAVFDKWRMNGN